MKDGFIKVAAATPEIHVADCAFNADNILALCREANEKGVQAVCFPELCLTGYTCSDLFLHNILLDGAKQQLLRIAGETAEMDMLIVVGLPVRVGGTLYNCAREAAEICGAKGEALPPTCGGYKAYTAIAKRITDQDVPLTIKID